MLIDNVFFTILYLGVGGACVSCDLLPVCNLCLCLMSLTDVTV